MFGYHFTSWEHWQKIKKEGLIPYELTNEQVYNQIGPYIDFERPKLIWLWREEPKDEKGTTTTTSVSTETHSVTKNGVSSNSVVTVETTVEIRDGRRKTTVTRTEAGSSDSTKQSSGTTGASGAKSSSGASGSSSGSSKSSSSGNQP